MHDSWAWSPSRKAHFSIRTNTLQNVVVIQIAFREGNMFWKRKGHFRNVTIERLGWENCERFAYLRTA